MAGAVKKKRNVEMREPAHIQTGPMNLDVRFPCSTRETDGSRDMLRLEEIDALEKPKLLVSIESTSQEEGAACVVLTASSAAKVAKALRLWLRHIGASTR